MAVVSLSVSMASGVGTTVIARVVAVWTPGPAERSVPLVVMDGVTLRRRISIAVGCVTHAPMARGVYRVLIAAVNAARSKGKGPGLASLASTRCAAAPRRTSTVGVFAPTPAWTGSAVPKSMIAIANAANSMEKGSGPAFLVSTR